jgi:hypothetical protein
MGRDYYKRFNYIYHPSYLSVYCDNEATEVAKRLGKYLYKPDSVYTHLHPSNVSAHWDALYEKNESPESYLASFFAVSLEDEQEADPAQQQLEDILEERVKGPFITITDMKALKEEVMTKVRERLQQKSSHA